MSTSKAAHYVKVQKFGGSSIGTAKGLRRVADIIQGEAERSRLIVVVSALSGVTNMLEDLARTARGHERDVHTITSRIVERHLDLSQMMLRPGQRADYLREFDGQVDALRRAVVDFSAPDRTERIVARGELMSAPLVAALLRQRGIQAVPTDARSLIRTKKGSSEAAVDRSVTGDVIRKWYGECAPWKVPVVTGFVARSHDGRTSLLGRGGSDYTASLIAEAVRAAKLDRWTDVDGLHTADPRRYEGTRSFLFMLLEDATTWNRASHLGMHRKAFEPALRACLPVHVRSTRHPERDGTLIMPRALAGRVEQDSRIVLARSKHRARCGAAVSSRRAAP